MITIRNISKSFDDIKAVCDVSFDIKENTVFGLIGTNGAGKSTIFRMLAGVYKPDSGRIYIDEQEIYDNTNIKKEVFFIPDEPYFIPNSNALSMAGFYSDAYEQFDMEEFKKYLVIFKLEEKRKINTYSKGMKKLLSMLLGICAKTKYLICDETFDGLDPVMRQAVKSIIAKEMDARGLTPIISSHNLRELEDICDHIGLIHSGGILLSKDLEDMKLNVQKVQVVFENEADKEKVLNSFEVLSVEKRGSLYTLTLRCRQDEAINAFSCINTVFFEALPLSLEEIFISETEVAGYDIKKILLG